jgi:hypothetical protein
MSQHPGASREGRVVKGDAGARALPGPASPKTSSISFWGCRIPIQSGLRSLLVAAECSSRAVVLESVSGANGAARIRTWQGTPPHASVPRNRNSIVSASQGLSRCRPLTQSYDDGLSFNGWSVFAGRPAECGYS